MTVIIDPVPSQMELEQATDVLLADAQAVRIEANRQATLNEKSLGMARPYAERLVSARLGWKVAVLSSSPPSESQTDFPNGYLVLDSIGRIVDGYSGVHPETFLSKLRASLDPVEREILARVKSSR